MNIVYSAFSVMKTFRFSNLFKDVDVRLISVFKMLAFSCEFFQTGFSCFHLDGWVLMRSHPCYAIGAHLLANLI